MQKVESEQLSLGAKLWNAFIGVGFEFLIAIVIPVGVILVLGGFVIYAAFFYKGE